MTSPFLKYAVTPCVVDYSGGPDALSVIGLTLTGQNTGASPVTCTQIEFNFGYGSGQNVLFADPTTIGCTADSITPWAIAGYQNGIWVAVPLPPATTVAPGQTIGFDLSNIVVNTVAGSVPIAITETAPDQQASTSVTVTKSQPATVGTTPKITSFTADPPSVAMGATTNLAWQVSDATSLVLQPGSIPLSNPVSGSIGKAVSRTTVFTLQAYAAGSDSQSLTVSVLPVDIGSFSVSPTTVASGGTATLSWSVDNAATVSIDQGIGPVAASGSKAVTPAQTTLYTLTTTGLNPESSSVTVEVTPT